MPPCFPYKASRRDQEQNQEKDLQLLVVPLLNTVELLYDHCVFNCQTICVHFYKKSKLIHYTV